MKRMIMLMVILSIAFCINATSFAEDAINVMIDGNYIEFDVAPRIFDGRTMVPIRTIFEKMGATVEWNSDTNSAICTKGNTVVKMTVDNMGIDVNNYIIWMDIPPFIRDGSILAPARYVAEAFGADVKWDEANSTVVITTTPQSVLSGKIIVVDAGHGINSSTKKEPIAPNSSETKRAFVSGTSGARQSEEQLNLSVSKKLQKILESKGATVYMTRTEHKTDVSNIDRAVFANNLGADISVKIHADGNNNKSVHGVSVLVPGNKYITNNDLIEKSRKAGEFILESFIRKTGAANRGIAVRNDLTGFNWSNVPIVLVELGFMSNPQEDKLMESDEYQNNMVDGIVEGLEKYFAN